VRATSSGQLDTDKSKTNTIGGNIEEFQIVATTPLTVNPLDSTCGDGVVGPLPTGITAYYGGGNEQCDDNNKDNGDGCSSDCNYVEVGYTCSRTNFGDRLSSCNLLAPRALLIGKLTALINGQCYPDCQHPGALYKNTATNSPAITYDNGGKLSPQEKINLLVQVGTALHAFFSQVVSAQSN
jgi:cysteine-rich repeat protein